MDSVGCGGACWRPVLIGEVEIKKEFWLERWERAEIGFHQN